MATLRDKIVDEDNTVNLDKWLDANAKVKMPDVLQSLREDYLTSVGPICKDKSPAIIVNTVNEA